MGRGILVIISSPSGAGKTTLARRLLAEFSQLEFSVSYTTRSPRKGERDGVDYHFVDSETFDRMVAEGAFAEWAQVHGNRYGTAREVVERALDEQRDVVFDVDWQGGRRLSARWPDDALTVFVLPPDLATLEQRLRSRATDSEAVIQSRLAKAIEELTHHGEYDHRIVNDDLLRAYRLLRAIYLTRRDGPGAHPELAALVEANRSSRADEHAEELIRRSSPGGRLQ
jgi:guanylate kinase